MQVAIQLLAHGGAPAMKACLHHVRDSDPESAPFPRWKVPPGRAAGRRRGRKAAIPGLPGRARRAVRRAAVRPRAARPESGTSSAGSNSSSESSCAGAKTLLRRCIRQTLRAMRNTQARTRSGSRSWSKLSNTLKQRLLGHLLGVLRAGRTSASYSERPWSGSARRTGRRHPARRRAARAPGRFRPTYPRLDCNAWPGEPVWYYHLRAAASGVSGSAPANSRSALY